MPVRVSSDLPPLPSPLPEADLAESGTVNSPTVKTEPAEEIIMFGFDSAKVSDRQSLIFLADDLKGDSSVIGIKVKGFTCDIGSKWYNDRLAKRRAWAVASIAGRTGLEIIDVSGQGKCCYVPGKRKLSRRAEIFVVRKVANKSSLTTSEKPVKTINRKGGDQE